VWFRAIRFCIVGGFVFAVDFAAIWAFKQFVPQLAAVSVAYMIAVAVHFCLNKWWVFDAGPRFCGREFARYAITVVACWLVTLLIVAGALKLFTGNVFIAKAIAIPPTTVLGFVLMRWFVFKNSVQ
jgi:putative flippase GtrA